MKKRRFSTGLLAVLMISAVTCLFLLSNAEEKKEFDPDTYDYDALYVRDGLVSWFDALSAGEGEPVTEALPDKSGNEKDWTLSRLNESYSTAWTYGDGYLQVSTGSKLTLDGVFAPPTETGVTQNYTVEYVFEQLDEAPRSVTAPSAAFGANIVPYRQVVSNAYNIGGWSLGVHYVGAEGREALKRMADDYLAASSNVSLQESYTLTLPKENQADQVAYDADGDGLLNYAETTKLLAEKGTTYYPLKLNHDICLQNGIGKTTLSVNGTWASDCDWKESSIELLRMKTGKTRRWTLFLNMSGIDGKTKTEASLCVDGADASTVTKTGKANTSVTLANDLATRIYAVRIYDRALTAEDMEQNHFADVCKFYQLDPDFYLQANETEKSLYRSALSEISVGSTAREDVIALIDGALDTLAKTQKNDYTELYVQDGLLTMLHPMSDASDHKLGDSVAAISDLAGHVYDVQGGTWTQNGGINIPRESSLDLKNILPTTGNYAVQIVYAHSDRPTGAATEPHSYQVMRIGPCRYTAKYAPPEVDSVAGGITKGYLNMFDGQSGSLVWKRDFDTSWGGSKQPDLFAEPYGNLMEFTNNFQVKNNEITVTLIKNGGTIGSSSVTYGEKTPVNVVFGSHYNKDLYAILIYDHQLSAAEMTQNHFANLMAYHQVDMSSFYTIVDEQIKLRLYSELAEVKAHETTAEYLQSTVDNFALTGGTLGVIKADDYIGFDGMQARLEDYASVRGLFYVDRAKIKQLEDMGCLVEYGILMAEAEEGKSINELTLVLDRATGEYKSADHAIAETVYRHGEFTEVGHTAVEADKAYFAATVPSVQMEEIDEEKLDRQYVMRGYLAIDIQGKSFVLYADGASALFGESISIGEAANYFLYAGYAKSSVLSALCGPYATAAATATLDTFLQAQEAYLTANEATKLILSAYQGAIAAREEYASNTEGVSIEMSLAAAMEKGACLATAKTTSLLYARIGLDRLKTATEQIAAARTFAEKIGNVAYETALTLGAEQRTAEGIRQEAGEKILLQIAEVESFLSKNADLKDRLTAVSEAYANDTSEAKIAKAIGAERQLMLNGKGISNYTIITDRAHMTAAETLQKLLLKNFSAFVGIYDIDNPYVGEQYDHSERYAVYVGVTDHGETVSDCDQVYSLYGEGRGIFIEGNTVEATEAGVALLMKELAPQTGRVKIELDRGENSYMNMRYTPLVSLNHPGVYAPVTLSSYDAEGVWQIFRQKVDELPNEMTTVSEKDPSDYSGSMKLQYYVSVDGSDKNSGTKEVPFATLQRALDAIAYEGGGVIWLRGGTYVLTDTPTVKQEHSGMASAPTFISAYPGETVTFTASTAIDAQTLQSVDSAIASGLISPAVRDRLNTFVENNHKNVYVTKLDDDYALDGDATAYLYVNGVARHISRYPNAGAEDAALGIANGRIPFSNTKDGTSDDVKKVGNVIISTSSLYEAHKSETGGWELYYDDAPYASRIDRYDLTDTQLYTYAAVYQEWRRDRYALTLHKDPSNGRSYIKSATPCQLGAMESGGNNLYFYNIIEELDSADEYYVDIQNRLLYIWSDTSPAETEILYNTNAVKLLSVTDASNIIVNGIDFTKTKATAVTCTGSSDVIFQNCKVSDIIGGGISVSKGVRCGVLSCDFSNTTGTMANVSGDIDLLMPTLNFVQNCYFHDPNEVVQWGLGVGGMSTVASHNKFLHTTLILDGAYECIVEYNEFEEGSQITYDSGPIYMSGPQNKRNNHIRYNLLHDLNFSRYGIYLDDMSSGNYVYCNIIEYAEENSGSGKCVNIHSGSQNVVYNNIGIRAGQAGFKDDLNYYPKTVNGVSTSGGGLSYRWPTRNEEAVTCYNGRLNAWGEEAFASRYPMMYWYGGLMAQHKQERFEREGWSADHKYTGVDDLELFLRSPFFNVYVNNVMVDCGTNGLTAYIVYTVGKNTAKLENNLAYTSKTDVGFVDPSADNYSFKADSVVYQAIPDFEEIPFARMGRLQALEGSK